MTEALIFIAVLFVGLYIGIPYLQAYKRRKELEHKLRNGEGRALEKHMV